MARVDVIQRPLLPCPDILHHRVGDPADQIPADRRPVDLAQVSLDMPDEMPDEMRDKLPDELVDELLAGAKT